MSPPAEQRRPFVAAVLLNHGAPDDTVGALETLATSDHRQLTSLVVDTGDGLGVSAACEQRFPGVTVLALDDNRGYAGGNNVGLAWALAREHDHVLVMNPDVRVAPNTIRGLVAAMEQDRRVGIAGCRMLHGGDPHGSIWFDGGRVDRARAGATSHLGSGERDRERPQARTPVDVDYVTGALMLLRRELVEDIGPLPERWFLYFEETDYNLRAQAAGWRTVVVPGVRASHHKRSAGRLPQPYYVYYFVRNRILFARDVLAADPELALEDLTTFLAHWRGRMVTDAPEGVAGFDRLVDVATEHALAGTYGRFDGLADLGDWS
jgi:GT2 family glycosyltransferase